jgi:hypothetical protein
MTEGDDTQLDLPYTALPHEKRLLVDFLYFADYVWKLRRLDTKAPLGEIEYDIMRWISKGPNEGGSRRRGALAPRGMGKTTFGTITYTLWRVYRNPNLKIMIVSRTQPTARKILREIRQCLITLTFMKHMAPSKITEKALDTMERFDVSGIKPTKDPTFMAIGVGGQLEGARADLIMADDVETRTNTKTPQAREDLNDYVREFSNIATFGDREIIYFGTYHHEDSLYLKLAARGYAFKTWPLLAPHSDHQILNLSPLVNTMCEDGRLRRCTELMSWDGQCILDYRLDDEYVRERVMEGNRNFGMQQMLLTDVGESMKHPLRLEDIIIYAVDRDEAPLTLTYGQAAQGINADNHLTTNKIDHITVHHGFGNDAFYRPLKQDPNFAKYSGTKAGLDPSQGGDPFGLSIVGHLNGWLYVKASLALPSVSSPDNMLRIVSLLRQHRADELHVESNNGGEAIARLIEPLLIRFNVERGGKDENGIEYPDGWHCSVHLIHNTGQKEHRILDALAAPAQMHKFVMDESVVGQPEFQRQWTMLTRQRGALGEDDMIDSLAIAVKPWNYELAIDAERIAERQRQEIYDEQLAEMQGRGKFARGRQKRKRFFKHF